MTIPNLPIDAGSKSVTARLAPRAAGQASLSASNDAVKSLKNGSSDIDPRSADKFSANSRNADDSGVVAETDAVNSAAPTPRSKAATNDTERLFEDFLTVSAERQSTASGASTRLDANIPAAMIGMILADSKMLFAVNAANSGGTSSDLLQAQSALSPELEGLLPDFEIPVAQQSLDVRQLFALQLSEMTDGSEAATPKAILFTPPTTGNHAEIATTEIVVTASATHRMPLQQLQSALAGASYFGDDNSTARRASGAVESPVDDKPGPISKLAANALTGVTAADGTDNPARGGDRSSAGSNQGGAGEHRDAADATGRGTPTSPLLAAGRDVAAAVTKIIDVPEPLPGTPGQQLGQSVMTALQEIVADKATGLRESLPATLTPHAPILKVLNLTMEPQNLGTLRVQLVLSGNSLSLDVIADKPETARMLLVDQEPLTQRLTDAGYDQAKMTVTTATLDPSTNQDSMNQPSQNQSSLSGRFNRSSDQSGAPASGKSSNATISDDESHATMTALDTTAPSRTSNLYI